MSRRLFASPTTLGTFTEPARGAGVAGGSRRLARAVRAGLEPLEARVLFSTVAKVTDLAGDVATFSGLTIDGQGNLFGVSTYGGSSGVGTVFEIPAGGTTRQAKVVAEFDGSNGSYPS